MIRTTAQIKSAMTEDNGSVKKTPVEQSTIYRQKNKRDWVDKKVNCNYRSQKKWSKRITFVEGLVLPSSSYTFQC